MSWLLPGVMALHLMLTPYRRTVELCVGMGQAHPNNVLQLMAMELVMTFCSSEEMLATVHLITMATIWHDDPVRLHNWPPTTAQIWDYIAVRDRHPCTYSTGGFDSSTFVQWRGDLTPLPFGPLGPGWQPALRGAFWDPLGDGQKGGSSSPSGAALGPGRGSCQGSQSQHHPWEVHLLEGRA